MKKRKMRMITIGLAIAVSAGLFATPEAISAADGFVKAPDAIGLSTNDPFISQSWHLKAANFGKAWDYLNTHSHQKIRVVVLDSGCEMNQPDLQKNINKDLSVDITKESGGKYAKLAHDADTNTWHGTCVTSIIGSTANNKLGTAGAASGYKNDIVEVVPVGVASQVNGGMHILAEDVIKGLKYAKSIKADVVNISLGNYNEDPNLEKTINDVVASGIVVCASAGNEGNTEDHFSSDYESVIGVVSIGRNGKLFNSNYGAAKDLGGPGEMICTSLMNLPGIPANGVVGMQMTSAATPVVSSAAALVLSAHPNYTVKQVMNALYSTATDLYTPGRDIYSGFGLVNAGDAVDGTAEKLTISKASLTLADGDTAQLSTTVTPSYLSDKAVTWKSSNPAVAKVSAKGKVTAVKKGTATLTATHTSTGNQATCKVKVTKVSVKKVTLSAKKLTMRKGEFESLRATVTPQNASDKKVSWTSSNKKVATVSANGTVTAKQKGTAKITVKTKDGAKKTTCKITVK